MTTQAQTARFENPRKYDHAMLNMAEDELDPFEYRLLGHYIRLAGVEEPLPESIKVTAEKCKMNVRTVRAARLRLVELGYIHVQEFTESEYRLGQAVVVTVLDRHVENALRFGGDAPMADMPSPVAEMPLGGMANMPGNDLKTNTVTDTAEVQKPKDKNSASKKATHGPSSVRPIVQPKVIIPPDLRGYFELIEKLTDTSMNSPVIWNYYHFFNGSVSKKRGQTDWYTYQLSPGMTEDELRRFMAYQKRQHEANQRPGKFFLRQPDTINNLVNKWRDKVRAQDADRAERAAVAL